MATGRQDARGLGLAREHHPARRQHPDAPERPRPVRRDRPGRARTRPLDGRERVLPADVPRPEDLARRIGRARQAGPGCGHVSRQGSLTLARRADLRAIHHGDGPRAVRPDERRASGPSAPRGRAAAPRSSARSPTHGSIAARSTRRRSARSAPISPAGPARWPGGRSRMAPRPTGWARSRPAG